MINAMKDIQGSYGGGNISEPQLEAVFRKWLPIPSASCNARLDQFFTQWFDTAYPSGGRTRRTSPRSPAQASTGRASSARVSARAHRTAGTPATSR